MQITGGELVPISKQKTVTAQPTIILAIATIILIAAIAHTILAAHHITPSMFVQIELLMDIVGHIIHTMLADHMELVVDVVLAALLPAINVLPSHAQLVIHSI